jgi:hypothetical protein
MQTLLYYANTGAILFGCGVFALLGISAGKFKIAKYLSILFLLVCLVLTGSRWGAVMTLALFVVYMLYLRGAKKAIIAIVSAAAVIIASALVIRPELVINSAFAMRMVYWSDASGALIRSPFFGFGPEGFIFRVHELQSAIYVVTLVHSAFLQVAVDAGIIALVSFLAICVIALRRVWRGDKAAFFMLLLLLLHSAADVNMSFLPALMILGFCLSDTAKKKHKSAAKAAVCAALVPLLAVSVYLHIGEGVYRGGVRLNRSGKLDEAAEAYRSALSWMPGDFRSSIRLAGVYILMHEQDKAIEFLLETNRRNFSSASRSELLVIAYKNLGRYPEWDAETLALLENAPFKQNSYDERAEYLLAAYYSMLLSYDAYEAEFKTLLGRMDEVNRSFSSLARFLLEKDRALSRDNLGSP